MTAQEKSILEALDPPDVNKRVSRLAANIPLIRQNLTPISFIDISRQDYTEAILAIYELNDLALLRRLFVTAYERSVARYAAIRESLGEPDRFRLKWREELKTVVAQIIGSVFNREEARKHLQDFVPQIPKADRPRFIETAEVDLMNLNEGNFARYRVRPSEFRAWHKNWNAQDD